METPAGLTNLPGGGIEDGESSHDAVRREIYEELGDGFEVNIDNEPSCCVSGPVTRERIACWEVFTGTVRIRKDKIPGIEGQISSENKNYKTIHPDDIDHFDQTPGRLASKAVRTVVRLAVIKQSTVTQFDNKAHTNFWNNLRVTNFNYPSE